MWPGQISSDRFQLNDQIFDQSGHHPLIAIYAIVLYRRLQFTLLCYITNHNLRNRLISTNRDLCDCVILPIAICTIVLFCRLQFMWSWYFSRSKVRTPGQPVQFFIGPGFDSEARLPVSGQCDSWPMSLAPTNGELGWWEKNLMGGKKHAMWLL